ncbi:hypothetical protein [Actinoplanes sp. NPDC049265]|uniref:hypothetical protein n=1 Tax=Actinoplanes sp. NPDC049265 TaxID=3363902 RepID=UPI0037226815
MSGTKECLRDGDYAIVRYTHGTGSNRLGQYRDPGGDSHSAYWAYMGTDWTDSPSQIRIEHRVRIVEVSP